MVRISKNELSNQGTQVKWSLLGIQRIPTGTRQTPRSPGWSWVRTDYGIIIPSPTVYFYLGQIFSFLFFILLPASFCGCTKSVLPSGALVPDIWGTQLLKGRPLILSECVISRLTLRACLSAFSHPQEVTWPKNSPYNHSKTVTHSLTSISGSLTNISEFTFV